MKTVLWIRIRIDFFVGWIRFRIIVAKNTIKQGKVGKSCFEVQDVLLRGPEASPVAWTSFMDGPKVLIFLS
jgi:hypothetical protein